MALSSLNEAGCAGVLAEIAYNSCNNVRALADIVVADGVIGFLPEPMVRDHVAKGRLVLLKKLPKKTMDFHASIRTQERDPLVGAIFDRAVMLRIN